MTVALWRRKDDPPCDERDDRASLGVQVKRLERRVLDAERVIRAAALVCTEIHGVEDGYQYLVALDDAIEKYAQGWEMATWPR